MNIHRLRRLFSRALHASLATPLVLAGCDGSEGSVDLKGYSEVACSVQGLAVSDLTLTPEPDFVQLRYINSNGGQPPVSYVNVSSSGEPCATATDVPACTAALEKANVTSGFHHVCVDFCSESFLVTTRGDEVKTHSTLEELQQVLGTIDTEQEAVLKTFAAGYAVSCYELKGGAVKKNADGSFNVIGTKGYACGPGTELTQHVVRVSASGEVQEQEQRVLEKGAPNCNIGRRPVGLQVAEACESPEALGRYFADAAHLEAASVHAFLRLRDELALHGADVGLQDAARRSAMEEVQHAQVTDRLARRFGGTPQRPVVEELPPRSLLDVALENAVEGCVRETYGALLAHHQALHARDLEVREAMVRIAEDETRHAALSWDIDQWARPRLSTEEREKLREAQKRAVAALREDVAVPLDASIITMAGMPTPEAALALLDTLEQDLWA
ncbi:putative lipoprotein [Corallococcus coralloides DSM 2259]|uniref:Putative lipoprotein n=1 Tax=Corallococcus coralloides (strain ATCC 25202 / DSM 2259 / NBRC 100086 / M2) TaxID=1144275 RepID=H8MIU5_CORCM|nr:ferritin-like domain-containing protein [Corallococcus coralloides]AFE03730.1 putative lipoprotein [Corallococcus coralloides DSM 2259]